MFGLLEQTHAEKLSGILGMFNKAKADLDAHIDKCSGDVNDIESRIASLEEERKAIVIVRGKAMKASENISTLLGQ